MPTIEVDQQTDDYLAIAARVAGLSKGQVVAQLVALAKAEPAALAAGGDRRVAIYSDYEGHRTNAWYLRGQNRIEIADGPLAGTFYKTPSEAASRVVAEYNKDVSPNRNGWTFWMIAENGQPLQTIRYEDI